MEAQEVTLKEENKFSKFGEDVTEYSNRGNKTTFECIVPDENPEEISDYLISGFVQCGLLDGVKE